VHNAIKQRRPFLEGDKGFRDYLLWISVLRAALSDDCIYIIVSNDHGFYDGKSEKIHPDLENEIKSLKLSGRILVLRSLVQVVENYIKPFLNSEQMVEIAIKSGKIVDFTDDDDSVSIVINEYLSGMEVPDGWVSKNYFETADFDIAEDVNITELVSTLQMDDSVLVTSKWTAQVAVNLCASGYLEDMETIFVDFTVESIVNPETLETESHQVVRCECSGWYDEDTKERIPL
jgi:hypothetical protein